MTTPSNTLSKNREIEFSFQDFWNLLKSKKSLIALTAAAFAVLAVLIHFLMPSYKARVTLMVNRAQNSPLQALMGKMTGTNIMGERTNEYQTKYLLYLDSYDFRIAAARKMMKDPAWDEYRAGVMKKTLIGTAIQNILYSQVKNVSSQDVELEKIAKSLKVGKFKKQGTDNIELTVKARKPELAVNLVNFISDAAVTVITEREITELQDAKTYVDAQLKDTENRIGDIDNAIVKYRKDSKYLTTDKVPEQIMEQIKTLKENIERTELKMQLNNKLIGELSEELEKERTDILSQAKGPALRPEVIDEMHRKLQVLREKRVLLEAQGENEDSLQITSLDKKIEEVSQQIREAMKKEGATQEESADSRLRERDGLQLKIYSLKRENQYLTKQLETYRKALVEASAPLEKLPEAVQTLIGFNRNTVMEYELLQEMKKKILEIEVEKISLKSKILVLEKATIASLPLRFGALPKLVAGLFLGVLLISGAIFGLDALLVTVKHRNDFQELEIPILGSSPRLSQGFWPDWLSALPEKFRPQKEVSLVELWKNDSDAPLVMAFNHIRSRAFKLRNSEGAPCQVFSVLGAKPGDGKSFVSVNLALSLAKDEKRVLLLDTDLRRSSVAETLGITESKGLSDVLTGKASIEKALIKNLAPHLDVLVAGPSVRRSTELLSSTAFSSLFESLKTQYDYVILDTPAVLPVVDAIEVAALSDVCILTANFGKTRWQDLENAVEKIRSMVAKPLVAIFNQVPEMHEYVYLSHEKRKPKAPTPKSSMRKVDVKGALARFSESISKEKT